MRLDRCTIASERRPSFITNYVGILLVVAELALYLPAKWASRVGPGLMLRAEEWPRTVSERCLYRPHP